MSFELNQVGIFAFFFLPVNLAVFLLTDGLILSSFTIAE